MLNIVALMMLAGVFDNTAAETNTQPDFATPVLVETKKEADNEIDKDVEAHVREYFSDIPIMVEVARCESHFTQFTKSGKVLRGKVVPADVGVMQINETYHLDRATKLGYDIHTLDGNLDYARHLYDEQGARPWLASAPCWAKSKELAKK